MAGAPGQVAPDGVQAFLQGPGGTHRDTAAAADAGIVGDAVGGLQDLFDPPGAEGEGPDPHHFVAHRHAEAAPEALLFGIGDGEAGGGDVQDSPRPHSLP